MDVAERYASVDGLNTRYLEAGRGPEIVLLHGASLGSSANSFDPILQPLASRGFRLLAFDHPGYGLTELPTDYSAKYRETFLLRFMDALGLERPNVLGHSQGGGVALNVVFDHPDRIAKLMVLGTGTVLPPLDDKDPEVWESTEELSEEPTLEWTRAQLEEHCFVHANITREVLEARHRMSLGRPFQAYLARREVPRATRPAGRAPAWRRIGETKVPLSFAFGANDERGGVSKRVPLLCQAYPELPVEVIDRCGHLMMWDAPDRLVELAGEFFRK